MRPGTRHLVMFAALTATAISAATGRSARAGEGGAPTASGTPILDNRSQLRAFMVFRTPMVVAADGKLRAAIAPTGKNPGPLPEFQSPLPPADWFKPEFDDTSWDRQLAPVEMDRGGATGHSHAARHTATVNSIICLRSKFRTEDPARCGEIRLSLKYVGGAVVYLNGEEVVRGHVAPGELKPETMAENYPEDLYCEAGGKYLQNVKDNPAGFERRYRALDGFVLPARLLRKGTNYLAIELRRAPINEKSIAAERVAVGGMYVVPGLWSYVGLNELSLSSAKADGVVGNLSRPGGIQVWNVAPYETIDAFSYGDPSEPLQPVTVNAAANSVFSGRLAVSSDGPIRGLKVVAGDLKTADGKATIPASAIEVRYAEPAVPAASWTPTERFAGLLEKIPDEIPVIKVADLRRSRSPRKGQPSGAVASIWLRVRVPGDAAAGTYSGNVTVSAQGLKAVEAKLNVNVSAWRLPDPKDFRIRNMICMTPESLSKHYGVPNWSEKHFELIGKSMDLLAEVNSRELAVNLGTDFYGTLGNEETMVRWVKGADGAYTYDFAPFDKFLDLAAKHQGKPLPLRLNCWGEVGRDGKNGCVKNVSLLDPASGKVEPLEQPVFGTEESYKFWKPVIDEALKKLKARGWLDVAAFGHNSYCYPVKPEVLAVASRLWPEGVWAYTAHNGTLGGAWKNKDGVSMPVKYSSCVWTEGRLTARGYRALLKPRDCLWNDAARCRHWDWSPLIVLRNLPEELIMRGHDGMADFGADNFPIENPQRKGRFFNLGAGRGTGGGNNASTRALLAPGPDGPVASERFEMFREGVELSEAIIFLERALAEKKISGELAAKVEAFLQTRGETFINYWYERGTNYINSWTIGGQFRSDAELLALAGEVAKATR